jgi:hypothetical protein
VTETPTVVVRRYAHEIAPEPSTEWPESEADLPRAYAAHHAARAQGFWLASERDLNVYPQTREWLRLALYEYRLAHLWWFLVRGAPGGGATVPEIAADLASDLEMPHVIPANIHTFCRDAWVNPDEVLPYGEGVEATP